MNLPKESSVSKPTVVILVATVIMSIAVTSFLNLQITERQEVVLDDLSSLIKVTKLIHIAMKEEKQDKHYHIIGKTEAQKCKSALAQTTQSLHWQN